MILRRIQSKLQVKNEDSCLLFKAPELKQQLELKRTKLENNYPNLGENNVLERSGRSDDLRTGQIWNLFLKFVD